ncbi:MAG: RDD family protein, partial [Candidatus Aminicenantes bacterium]|nr:RDD family protein [Candidatus Aminicenantes bacterium]
KQKIYQPPDSSRETALAGTPLASFTRRVIALLIDFLVAGIMFILLAVGIIFIVQLTGLVKLDPDLNIDFRFFGNWYSAIWLVLYFTLSVYLSNGRTIGKRLCRIRVMSLVHDRVGLWHAFERAIGYGASTLEFGFGFFQYFIRSDRRTIHDRIAETIVIAELPKKKKGEGTGK